MEKIRYIVQNITLERVTSVYLLSFIILNIITPKIPIFAGTGTTPIHIDDLWYIPLVLLTIILMIKQRKILPLFATPVHISIIAFLGVCFLSNMYNVTFHHLSLQISTLFLLRTIQYTSIFFIAYWLTTSFKLANRYFYILILFSLIPASYAILQKAQLVGAWGGGFYNWAYVPTTNRVFATFGGPYELAGYTLIIIILTVYFINFAKTFRKNLSYYIVFLLLVLTLSYTASRSPVISVFIAILFSAIFMPKKVISLLLAFYLLFFSFFISNTLYERSQLFIDAGKGIVLNSIHSIFTPQTSHNQRLVANSQSESNTNTLSSPAPASTSHSLPTTATQVISTYTTHVFPKSSSTTVQSLSTATPPPTLSESVEADASLQWRIQNLWPKSINNFKRNPLVGSGLSSNGISSDSSYITILGEDGALGIVCLALIYYFIFSSFFKNMLTAEDKQRKAFFATLLAIFLSIAVYAAFIDVYRASKIATLYWFIIGIGIKSIYLPNIEKSIKKRK